MHHIGPSLPQQIPELPVPAPRPDAVHRYPEFFYYSVRISRMLLYLRDLMSALLQQPRLGLEYLVLSTWLNIAIVDGDNFQWAHERTALEAAITHSSQNALSSIGKGTLNSGSIVFSVDTLRPSMTKATRTYRTLARTMLQITPRNPKKRVAGIPKTNATTLAAPLAKNNDRGDSMARNRMAGPRAALHTMVSAANSGSKEEASMYLPA